MGEFQLPSAKTPIMLLLGGTGHTQSDRKVEIPNDQKCDGTVPEISRSRETAGRDGLILHQREHDFGYGDKADGERNNGDGD